ncbi:RNA exonuclease 4 [Diachasma alloeum]|uniref:RNA exonuclease 4 n=1 Tax=Diachasma alloeum TaxID=454923 RepID=UPI000738123B|nr:RNA exonuclease 4 [Diachasma alloeum]
MLSKMMAPEMAKCYADSVKSTRKNTTVESKENEIQPQEVKKDTKKAKSSSRSTNSNWQKYKDLVNTPGTQKSPSKRHSTNSEVPYRDKRVAKGKKAPHLVQSQVTNIMANMDLNNTELTNQVAIDCEMVGIGDGTESMLARISIVNRHGACIYDKYVKPRETVQDYRTPVSGIRPHHLQNGEEFDIVQAEVANILRGKILIGHALKNDLAVLFLSHQKKNLRDTSRYKLFRMISKGNTPSLKKLAAELLGIEIQSGEHNSVEDARTAMQLYVLYRNRWESDIRSR